MNIDESLKLFGLISLEGQTESSLKKLYHNLAQQYHPDKGGSTKDFIALRRAYIYLRTSLIDPKTRSHGSSQNQKYQNEKKYYSDQTSSGYQQTYTSSNNSSRDNTGNKNWNNAQEDKNDYRQAYTRAAEQIKQYEEVFNAQVHIINSTNKTISEGFSGYSSKRDKLKQTLDDHLKKLDKHYNREWWQYVIPVPKIDRDFYIKQYNAFITSYNDEVKKIDEDYVQGLLDTYQSGFKQIIDYLK